MTFYDMTRIAMQAAKAGISIHYVSESTIEVKSKIGIHLDNPTMPELMDAVETAERDLFPAIYIHAKGF